MTGTGTADDPYIVDNYTDLAAACAASGVYVKMAAGIVIDMNEVAPGGTSLTLSCAELDGNGAKILNWYSGGNMIEVVSSLTVKNLSLLNFYIKGSVVSLNYRSHINLKICILSGVCESSVVNAINGDYAEYYRCAFNINCTGNGVQVFFAGAHYTGSCNIKITTKNGITGNLVGSNNYLAGDFLKVIMRGTANAVNAKVSDLGSYSDSSNSVVNSDLFQGEINVPSGFTAVTTAQMKDPEYLAGIGFPIGVD